MTATIQGALLIGGVSRRGAGPGLQGFDPAAGVALAPVFNSATRADVAEACKLAEAAFDAYRSTSSGARAAFLEGIAANLEADVEAIARRAMAETGLPEARIRSELARTTGQLRMFGRVVREGSHLDVRIDEPLPQRLPPRPDIRLMKIPVGPVAVFGASNFPLAFSVAGGDTASALAAGCPVVVKAHAAHPGTSELVGRAIQDAAAAAGMPVGVFALLFDAGIEIGAALVEDARIQAVGFTGSRRAGLALIAIAGRRRRPIPVFAEMSAINPVLLLPGALKERGEAVGRAFAAALTLGAGQFCTNPGLVLAMEGPHLAGFIGSVRSALLEAGPSTMLTPGIHRAYSAGVSRLAAHARVALVAEGRAGEGMACQPKLFATTASDALADRALIDEEIFGAASLVVCCEDEGELERVLDAMEGQLTVAVHLAESDEPLAQALLPKLERLAGRIVFNGFGTGVEVCDAMVHGGPFPATGDGRSTSVGTMAIDRFLRPVCYQDAPSRLLPPALQSSNPLAVPRRINGLR